VTKPLLLIVDDDRSLLEALEAELEPVFGRMCSIETFDRPADLLEALPRWQAARQPIALAIVDQKMPGFTGIELIQELRRSARAVMDDSLVLPGAGPVAPRFHPASTARTVLLTGYGGPEVALAARTQAGADRYREKPWSGRQLAVDVRDLLSGFCCQASRDPSVLPRESVTPDELCRLRVQLESLPGNQADPDGADPRTSGSATGDEPPDALTALLVETGRGRGPGTMVPSLGEPLLAFARGEADAEQQDLIRTALLESPALRAALMRWFRDLDYIASNEAKQAFDRTAVPDFVRQVIRPKEAE
jgi:CheY-like chemotaxis protein